MIYRAALRRSMRRPRQARRRRSAVQHRCKVRFRPGVSAVSPRAWRRMVSAPSGLSILRPSCMATDELWLEGVTILIDSGSTKCMSQVPSTTAINIESLCPAKTPVTGLSDPYSLFSLLLQRSKTIAMVTSPLRFGVTAIRPSPAGRVFLRRLLQDRQRRLRQSDSCRGCGILAVRSEPQPFVDFHVTLCRDRRHGPCSPAGALNRVSPVAYAATGVAGRLA